MRYTFLLHDHQRAELIRTIDAFSVCDGAAGAQSIVVLLVAHQRVHAEDGCDWPRVKTQPEKQTRNLHFIHTCHYFFFFFFSCKT